jgi:hypothetical protein
MTEKERERKREKERENIKNDVKSWCSQKRRAESFGCTYNLEHFHH